MFVVLDRIVSAVQRSVFHGVTSTKSLATEGSVSGDDQGEPSAETPETHVHGRHRRKRGGDSKWNARCDVEWDVAAEKEDGEGGVGC